MPVAIVTGSDSGIGEAAAVRLAHDGFDVGVTWHADEAGGHDTAAKVRAAGRRAELRYLDLSAAGSGAAVVAELADALGAVDALVNNAGVGDPAAWDELTVEEFRAVLEVDLVGAFACAQEAAKRMRAAGTGGRIVNVTSIHEHIPLAGRTAYSSAKGGLGLLTKSLALELAGDGILVNAVAPGEIATPMTGNEDVDPHTIERPAIPLRRPGDAREIAAVISFLCSPDASYITGASILADGGLALMAAVQERQAP
jgi:NAD(P)-dependent dehydrogenase (short-subunit alcohol dehydrogenase family)